MNRHENGLRFNDASASGSFNFLLGLLCDAILFWLNLAENTKMMRIVCQLFGERNYSHTIFLFNQFANASFVKVYGLQQFCMNRIFFAYLFAVRKFCAVDVYFSVYSTCIFSNIYRFDSVDKSTCFSTFSLVCITNWHFKWQKAQCDRCKANNTIVGIEVRDRPTTDNAYRAVD